MQEVVGQTPNFQPGLIGLKALPAGLVPVQGVLPLLDPVFDLGPAVIDLDHLPGREPGVADHKADPEEQLPPVPFNLGHHPAGINYTILSPFLRHNPG